MKSLLVLCVIGMLLLITGCSSIFTPENSGTLAGKSLYIAYLKVSENKDVEFKEKVEKLWTFVNTINSKDDLVASYDMLKEKFNDCINSKELSEADKKILISVSNDILDKISTVINDSFVSNDVGIQFLIGVRDGVNSMISI